MRKLWLLCGPLTAQCRGQRVQATTGGLLRSLGACWLGVRFLLPPSGLCPAFTPAASCRKATSCRLPV